MAVLAHSYKPVGAPVPLVLMADAGIHSRDPVQLDQRVFPRVDGRDRVDQPVDLLAGSAGWYVGHQPCGRNGRGDCRPLPWVGAESAVGMNVSTAARYLDYCPVGADAPREAEVAEGAQDLLDRGADTAARSAPWLPSSTGT